VVGDKNLAEHKSKPVQTEVQYSPEIDWVAYDISYKTKENPEKQGMFHNAKVMKQMYKPYSYLGFLGLLKTRVAFDVVMP